MTQPTDQPVSIKDFQSLIREMYLEKDAQRGVAGTFMWLAEEFGELASDLRNYEQQHSAAVSGESDGSDLATLKANLAAEFADVLAWLTTIANVVNVDLADAITAKYGDGCPGCRKMVCCCDNDEKP